MPITRVLAVCLLFSGILLRAQEDVALDTKLQAIAAAHHGRVTLFARNLRTGQTAAIAPDELVQTASVIKLAILYEALEQIRVGTVHLEDKITEAPGDRVAGSGILTLLDAPLTLTF